MISERMLEIIFSLFLCVIAVWIIIEGYALSLGNLDDIGSGFLLFFEAILMVVLCSFSVANAISNRRKPIPAFDSRQRLLKVGLTIFITMITAVFFEILGFVLMASLFMVLLMKFVGNERYLRLSLVMAVTISLSYLIFSLLLNIQLPAGPFGF